MAIQRWADDDNDDLVGLDLGKGPLHLTLSHHSHHSHHQGHGHGTTYSDAGDETSASGSALFSESEDDGALAASPIKLSPAVRSQPSGAEWHASPSMRLDDDDSIDDDDGEEKSNTIKAGQLPASFAAQLAASKAEKSATIPPANPSVLESSAAVVTTMHGTPGGQVRHLGSAQQSPEQAQDWAEDIEGLGFGGPDLLRPLKHQHSFASHISDLSTDGDLISFKESAGKQQAGSGRRLARATRRADEDDDVESDFDLPEAVHQLSLASPSTSASRSVHREASISELVRSHSPRLPPPSPSPASSTVTVPPTRPASRSSSISTGVKGTRRHARSATSLSARSGGSDFTDRQDDDDDDIIEGIEFPAYFGSAPSVPAASTANQATAPDLKAILKEKAAARAARAAAKSASASASVSASSVSTSLGKRAGGAALIKAKYRERAEEEDLEEGLEIRDPAADLSAEKLVAHLARSDRPTALPNLGKGQDRHARPALRPARSSASLLALASQVSTGSSGAHDRPHMLRSRTSSSNLSVRPQQAGSSSSTALPHSGSRILSKRPSIQYLFEHAAPSDPRATPISPFSSSSSSSNLRYAQPTRSSLARHHPSAEDMHSSYSQHLRSQLLGPQPGHSTSRPTTPVSGGMYASPHSTTSSTTPFSRLTQSTAASRAKARHVVRGSDPSGRSSAHLGRPFSPASIPGSSSAGTLSVPVSRSNSLSYHHHQQQQQQERQPSRRRTFGDGSELDGFDDLPVNRDKERRLVKVPRKRMSSAGAESSLSLPAASGGGALQHHQVAHRLPRERMDSAPDQLQNARRRLESHQHQQQRSQQRPKPSRSDTNSTTATVTSVTSGRAAAGSLGVPDHPNAGRKASRKRPALKLIRNLNASNLTKIQGEMRFNPVLMKWEGNENDGAIFEDILASSARPALISPVFGPMSPRVLGKSPLSGGVGGGAATSHTPGTGSGTSGTGAAAGFPFNTPPHLGGVRIVGDMIFDPTKMCWQTMAPSGEEELDFGDDEADWDEGDDEGRTDAWKEGEHLRSLKTRRSFARGASADLSARVGEGCEEEEDEEWDEEAFRRECEEAQKRHDEETVPWSNRRTMSPSEERRQLWDILDIIDT